MRYVKFFLLIFVTVSETLAYATNNNLFETKTNVVIINEKGTFKLICEVAKKPEELAVGLMFRKDMKTNEGMIFLFPNDGYISFWMKNTYLPLAIVYIDNNKRVVDVFYPPPLSTKGVKPSKPSRFVLEILSNTAIDINLKRGDKVLF
ncbi:MAG: DUF192 domain-containing protein [Brevinematales bacterium]|nr:DUF192 domain-containing protein [Brevinematales bacterium]